MRRTKVQDLIDACLSGNQWHNTMIRLVAHLASKDRTNAEIMAIADHITLPGYTVEQTAREMWTALQSARTKFNAPEPLDDIEAEESAREEADAIFELLDMDELENMPPPSWLVEELIVDDGLSVIYGDPGAGKSFIALDMSLRIALGMDWHGTQTQQTGVLYIAGEGKRGLGKRIRGWRKEHAMEGVDAPFLLLPTAVELADEKQRNKLLRTIDAAKDRAGFEIGLIVVDTVSRALAGGDENGSDAMGQFVAACDAIKHHAGGALIGVHHSGKDKDKGMRGSTVLLGACDAAIRLTKDEQLVTMKTEKQKDAEQSEQIYMTMKKVTWAEGLEKEESTLVPFRSEASRKTVDGINRETVYEILKTIDDAWQSGSPLSPYPQSKRVGLFAPSVIANQFNITVQNASRYIEDWLMNGVLVVEELSSHSKAKGLRVMDWIMP